MQKHQFSPSILRAYDIRGIVGETLSRSDASAIGSAFAQMLGETAGRTVVIGYDGRLSSPDLAAGLIEGLVASGVDVVNIGCGPTPMLYYASKVLDADGAIMVTGSHNPPTHNGFKMVMGNKPFFGEQIQRLGEIAAAGVSRSEKTGTLREHDISDEYVARLRAEFSSDKALKVVWDPGNGASGDVVQALTATLPGQHILLNEQIDGTFPAHHPDPTEPENLEQLIGTVLSEGADLGIAFDGDGDRIGIVDGQGRILWGDQIMVILAEDLLKSLPGATIIADVKASQALFDQIAAMGGKPMMWRTGHSLIKTKMAEMTSPLAGEMSGHIFYADRYYGFDDAMYAAMRLLDIISRWSYPSLAARYDVMPKMLNTPEIRIDCADERKFSVVEEVKARLTAANLDVSDLDGVRVNQHGGWWLLRASNTQAVLVGRCEAPDEKSLNTLKNTLRTQLEASGVTAVF